MRKMIIGGIAVLAIAAVAAFNMNLSKQSNFLASVSLANVEALAGECTESSNESNNTGHCKAKVSGSGDSCVTPGFWDSKNCDGEV